MWVRRRSIPTSCPSRRSCASCSRIARPSSMKALAQSASGAPDIIDKLRKPIVVAGLCLTWELTVRGLKVNPLLFPSFSEVMAHLLPGLGFGGPGELWPYIWDTLKVLLQAYAISVALAVLLTGFAVGSRWAREVLSVL